MIHISVMSDKKKRRLEEALSREVLTLKQKINIQGLDRDALRADLALAEKKHDDLKKKEEINTKTFEDLLDVKDLEIQQLKNKFHEMSSIVFEKRVKILTFEKRDLAEFCHISELWPYKNDDPLFRSYHEGHDHVSLPVSSNYGKTEFELYPRSSY